MSSTQEENSFLSELAALRERYGAGIADLQIVRFNHKKDGTRNWQDFTPYWCRMDDDGFITCEEERPV